MANGRQKKRRTINVRKQRQNKIEKDKECKETEKEDSDISEENLRKEGGKALSRLKRERELQLPPW